MLDKLRKDLDKFKNPEKAKILARFFKTGKGEYGEGDKFLGITVPVQRQVAKKYKDLSLPETQQLINSKIHEHRLVALLILIEQYKKASVEKKKEIFDFYLKNTKNINNWDLVDLSAPNIVGECLMSRKHHDKSKYQNPKSETIPKNQNTNDKNDSIVLYNLAKSKNIWEKRIAVLATFAFIKNNLFSDSLNIAEILLSDKHDLIHKAVGWMLREVGKRDTDVELEFLNRHYKNMPRTMLRYAIEKLDLKKKTFYMKKVTVHGSNITLLFRSYGVGEKSPRRSLA